MASVTGLTAARMLAIEAESIVGGVVNGAGHLILTKHDTTTIDAGPVIGPLGPTGPTGPASPQVVTSTTRPSAPTNGTLIYESDTKKAFLWNGTLWVPWGWAPACRAIKTSASGAVTLPSGTWVPIPFNAESFDTDNMHDNVTNPGYITIKTPGLYRVQAVAKIEAIGTGAASQRILAITLNDAAETVPVSSRIAMTNKEFAGAQSSECIMEISALYQFALNDFIQAALYQNSTVAGQMQVNTYPNLIPTMTAEFVSP